jgi:hypothetical protein
MIHGHGRHALFDYFLEAARNSHTMNKNKYVLPSPPSAVFFLKVWRILSP